VLLALAAHCDDGELWAGGVIAKLVEAGKPVVLAVANYDPIRRKESEASGNILGCDVWFRPEGLDPGEWVSRCVVQARPEVLMTHPLHDPHFEHRELSNAVMRGLTKSRDRRLFPARWYWFDTYYSTHSEGTPVLVDISPQFSKKLAALKRHWSQTPTSLIDMARTMNTLSGRKIRVQYAEAFYMFPLLGRWPQLRDSP
jgi:N-acetylglucosamine malate deacetylase 1